MKLLSFSSFIFNSSLLATVVVFISLILLSTVITVYDSYFDTIAGFCAIDSISIAYSFFSLFFSILLGTTMADDNKEHSFFSSIISN